MMLLRLAQIAFPSFPSSSFPHPTGSRSFHHEGTKPELGTQTNTQMILVRSAQIAF